MEKYIYISCSGIAKSYGKYTFDLKEISKFISKMVIPVFIPTSKYFLQVCGLCFHSHNDVFQRVEVIVLSILICFGTFIKSRLPYLFFLALLFYLCPQFCVNYPSLITAAFKLILKSGSVILPTLSIFFELFYSSPSAFP